ncbi:MAG: DUF488 domain-containing protein [Gemmatimonadales bacterium]|jgi:uncharacterized protein (DUF488 family)
MFTIGHSTREIGEFVDLLREFGVTCLVDVRRFPSSKRYPHFAASPLAAALAEAGFDYVHEPDLGGYRKGRADSPNTAWRSGSFRAYADYMEAPEFREALERLMERAGERVTAIMCAEATPWRCHRQLISDVLVARGWDVIHILGTGRAEAHAMNPNARVLEDGRLIYRDPGSDQGDLFPDAGP